MKSKSFIDFGNKYFNIYESCFVTRGYKRSLIADSQRNFFYFIPNDLFDIIQKYRRRKVAEILKDFGKPDKKTIFSYFKFLLEKELAFFTDQLLPFEKVSLDINAPFELYNVVIDFRKTLTYDLYDALSFIEKLNARDIQFRIFDKGMYFFKMIIEALKCLTFRQIDILVNYESTNFHKKFLSLAKENANISTVTFYDASASLSHLPNDPNLSRFFYYSERLVSKEMCGTVRPEQFNTNFLHYIESLKHNTCLNRKIAIDETGLIRHCPSMVKDFGTYSRSNLLKALSDKQYKEVSSISKDQISVCRICEFRNVCTDCRAYLKEPGNIYSKPRKCNYDPFKAEWVPV